MARSRKILKRLSLTFLFLVIGFFISVFLYFKFGGFLVISEEERNHFVNEVKSSSQLPDGFYEAYNTIYSNSLENGQLDYFIDRDIKKKSGVECPCRLAAYESGFTEYVYKNLPLSVFYIENYVSQKECLNYYAARVYFSKEVIGVEQASKEFFGKDIKDMDNTECLKLVRIMSNPSIHF